MFKLSEIIQNVKVILFIEVTWL